MEVLQRRPPSVTLLYRAAMAAMTAMAATLLDVLEK